MKKTVIIVPTTILFIFISFATKSFAFYDAKLEPPDGQIYHGSQAEVRPASLFSRHVNWNGMERYVEACGQRPKLIMHYITMDSVGFYLLKSTIVKIGRQPYDYIPQIGLDFYSYFPHYDILNPKDITERIAGGEYDHRIKNLAELFAKMETPVFLRPGYEFGENGQGRYASKSFWIKAWRRIYNIFQRGGAENVAFVWNTLDAKDFMDYYPGDGYVDWWAINVFNNNADQDLFINYFIQQAAAHQKPVMIAESTPRPIGSVGGQLSWERWYQPYFSLISKYPHLKAFCYINASWKNYPDPSFVFDCRIQSNSLVAAKYREILSEPKFINAVKK